MKTLHVTIRLGVGPGDDGSFDDFDARSIWNALCRAFPLCRGEAIVVEPVNICDLVVDEPPKRSVSEDALIELGRQRAQGICTCRDAKGVVVGSGAHYYLCPLSAASGRALFAAAARGVFGPNAAETVLGVDDVDASGAYVRAQDRGRR
jgi:hypothetical protein